MKAISIFLACLFCINVLFSQNVANTNNQTGTATPATPVDSTRKPIRKPIDGIYDKTQIYNRTPIQYVPLREADAMWSKKVWRRLDLREKINHPLHFPNIGYLTAPASQGNWLSFWEVLYAALDSSEINPYPKMIYMDEYCNLPMLPPEFRSKMGYESSRDSVDDQGNFISKITENIYYRKSKFLAIDLKEVWFLDKQRSVLDVRIIALSPVLLVEDNTANVVANIGSNIQIAATEYLQNVGWLYFPEIRPVLAMNDVFNSFNTSEMKSFDDIFWKRKFSSFVQREENIYNNREIEKYMLNGLDQVLESERITNEIRKFEHDMWEF